MAAPVVLRPILPSDDDAVAAIIRAVMPAFGASGPGFAILDPEVSAMSSAYAAPRSRYLVLDREGVVVGGGGFAPLEGAEPDICEIRKMYFLPEVRGAGLGGRLLDLLLSLAGEEGYRLAYLETLESMDDARRLYEKRGFLRRATPLGNTGHFGCNRWYELALPGNVRDVPARE